jgi:predicted permease
MFGLVVLMLLIACTNVANLLLARAAAHRREIALRLALGISRLRLIRQLLTENLVLSVFSTFLGTVIAYWGKTYLLRLASSGSTIPLDTTIDGRILGFVIALSATTTLLFGLAPIWDAVRLDVMTPLRTARDSASGRTTLGHWLVASQVALSLVLLMGAGLFLKTLINLRSVDLGYKPEHLSIIDVNPQAAGYEANRYALLASDLLRRVETIPGIASATFSENGTLIGRDSGTNRMRPENFAGGPEDVPHADFDLVGPNYFSTMGLQLIAGRDFRTADTTSSEAVVVINQTMALRFFPGTNPVGRRMLWGARQQQRVLTVVGVARDVKHESLRSRGGLRFYIPYLQQPERELASLRLIARTADGDDRLAALQQAVRSMDPRIPIVGVTTVPALVERTLVQEHLAATLSTLFAVNALVLTCIGLYGLMSYRAARRTNEIGIRMALGSSVSRVIVVVMHDAAQMVVAGTVTGVVAVWLMSRFVAGLLFGITSNDSTTLLAAIGFMLAFAGIAAYVPARRAARVDPLVALHHD